MKLTASDLGKVKYKNPSYFGKPSDVDWDRVNKEMAGWSAKDISEAVGCTLTAVYKADYRGDIKLSRVYHVDGRPAPTAKRRLRNSWRKHETGYVRMLLLSGCTFVTATLKLNKINQRLGFPDRTVSTVKLMAPGARNEYRRNMREEMIDYAKTHSADETAKKYGVSASHVRNIRGITKKL